VDRNLFEEIDVSVLASKMAFHGEYQRGVAKMTRFKRDDVLECLNG
jgi:hypothetical protein